MCISCSRSPLKVLFNQLKNTRKTAEMAVILEILILNQLISIPYNEKFSRQQILSKIIVDQMKCN